MSDTTEQRIASEAYSPEPDTRKPFGKNDGDSGCRHPDKVYPSGESVCFAAG